MVVPVIAELCKNHQGDREILKRMVAEASAAGATYAKLQTLQSKNLVYRQRFDDGLVEGGEVKIIKRPYRDDFEMIRKSDTDDNFIGYFLDLCSRYDILPMTTIFTRDTVDKTFRQGFAHIKIASFDCGSLPLIQDVIDKEPSLLLVSTGATYSSEVKETASILPSNSGIFHCTSIYPTPLHQSNLSRISYLRSMHNSVGLSDHSSYEVDQLTVLKHAMCLGISYLERHFTVLSKDLTKDGVVSLNPAQLAEAVEICNWDSNQVANFASEHPIPDVILGDPHRELTHQELLNRDFYRGRAASRTKDGALAFNWDSSINRSSLVHL